MPRCGSQCILCDVPIRFDTYAGCSFFCSYCFVKRKVDLRDIKLGETPKSLKSFIKGERTKETAWCDWDIPLHVGGMSDPFQPCEKIHKNTLSCLKVFADTHYPFIISTKGKLQTEKEYTDVFKDCNFVFQQSMLCSDYDKFERGAPRFEDRLKAIEVMSKTAKRTIVRAQPFVPSVTKKLIENIPRFRDAGVYGVIVEAMKYFTKREGLVKFNGDMVYPKEILLPYFKEIKEACHAHGLVFLSGENRLRTLGDSLSCCGTEGLDGFKVNTFNLNSFKTSRFSEITPAMEKAGSAYCFKAMKQTAYGQKLYEKSSFVQTMKHYAERLKSAVQ